MAGEDTHLEAAYEERHEVDLAYSREQEYAMDDCFDAELDDSPEPQICDQDPCLCGYGCDAPELPAEHPHGYWEAGNY